MDSPDKACYPLLRVLWGCWPPMSQGSLTCLPSLGLHTCSMTGDPGEDIKVEVAVRHFPCCWMRWSLNSHACETRKDSSGWTDG
jgi:hypothetical protein